MNDEYFDYKDNQENAESLRLKYFKRMAEFEYIKNRWNVLYGISFLAFGLISILTKDIVYGLTNRNFSVIFTISGALSGAIGIGIILFRYLQNGSFSKFTSNEVSNQSLQSEIQDLRFELIKLRKKNGEATDYENISKTINDAVNGTITEDFIKTKIDSFYSEKIIYDAKRRELLSDFENLSYRINGELTRLRKSANLNLVIGSLTTICAIVALGYEVFNSDLNFSDTTKVLAHYVPRVSLIIFVEIFAFFFLKLYKATLADIKYFNNEKTNIDFKSISLKTALNIGDPKLIQTMIEELIRTERNFKLGKDESTVELEKIKSDTNNVQIISQFLENLGKK